MRVEKLSKIAIRLDMEQNIFQFDMACFVHDKMEQVEFQLTCDQAMEIMNHLQKL